MLSIFEITIALIVGILWGLYLETSFLFIASIFLYILVLKFYKKYNLIYVILLIIAILSSFYTKEKLEIFDTRYSENLFVNMNITITSHLEESDYTYKYNGKNEKGEKFIFYFKRSENSIFEVGENLNIEGEFNLPELARNRGGFNYRRYLNSNGIYGVILVSSFSKENVTVRTTNIIYLLQNLVYKNFQKLLLRENARSIKWYVNTVKFL